jgi:predicted transcriptional regulator
MAKTTAKSVTITARIPAALAKKLETYAKATKRSRSWLVEDMLDRYVDHEIAFVKFVQEGIDAADRGELIAHEEVFRKIKEKSAARRKAMNKKAA